MTQHMTGTREEWLAARLELLAAEKELTRRSDELARRRQELPWVRIDKEYRFETDEGSASLADLFPRALAAPHLPLHVRARLQGGVSVLLGDRGRLQRPPSVHLANHDVTLAAVSRAPLAKLQAYKQRMGWTLPLGVLVRQRLQFRLHRLTSPSSSSAKGTIEYNYRREPAWTEGGIGDSLTKLGEGPVAELAATTGTDVGTYTRERPGMSAFVLEDGARSHRCRAAQEDRTVGPPLVFRLPKQAGMQHSM